MDIIRALDNEMLSANFGSSQYRMDFKPRPHISKVALEEDVNVKYVKVGDSVLVKETKISKSYVAALDLTYDFLVSLYDVNSKTLLVCRAALLDSMTKRKLLDFMNKIRGPRNVEVRLMGLQNTQDKGGLGDIVRFIKGLSAPLVEVDVFGDNIRNIAVEAHRGMSFDILALDRLYKPGELVNKTTREQFERGVMGGL